MATPSTTPLVVKSVSKEELDACSEYYTRWKGQSEATKSEDGGKGPIVIPRFYEKPPKDDGLPLKLFEEARSLFLQRKSHELLTNEELKAIWSLLEEHHTPPVVNEDKMIRYDDFKAVAEKADPKCKSFLTPELFAKLQQKDPFGRVSIMNIFNYIMRKTWLRQSRIGLSLYDISGQGYLTENDLELYISELIPSLARLECLEEGFVPFYICIAVRRFVFFLDTLRQGRIRIVDILASGFLDDLLELRTPKIDDTPANSKDPEQDQTPDRENWFSPDSAVKIYAQYLNLDEDRNGVLSKKELAKYGTGTMTDVFLDRIYQECLTYDGTMDFKAYLDFVLAQTNKKDPAALQYFFKILDVKQTGYIDAFVINYFFRAIQQLLEENDQQPVYFEDVKDEIFDMVKPKDPHRITLQDLINSGTGETVVNILTDYNGFMTYENREVLATEDDEDDDEDDDDDDDGDENEAVC